MGNREKVILDLCGGTGAWSRPYQEAGYDVKLITHPRYDVTKVDFEGHWMHFPLRDMHWQDHMLVDCREVYGILAAPPCTEFSLAKGGRTRDFATGVEVLDACLKIIWQCRIHNKLAFWALENPVGFMRQFMGRPHFTFKQWQYGDTGIKPTDIWGYFNEPAPKVKEKPEGLTKRYANGRTQVKYWNNANCPEEYKNIGLSRAAKRAITPAGFAEAFYKTNQ